MLLTVDVTKEDINQGRACSAGFCPIALALRRHPGLKVVGIGREEIYTHSFYAPRLRLPRKAQRFIVAFDHGEPVAPFTFKLKLPRKLQIAP